ncbi:hypothetical protein ACFQ6U_18800 [Streptomyces sp. NPDC056465]|uniref:hypothetical protein n=1 Tax=Streptomyces sp. NPDC056465 TaxID=3345829 RepID=UPI0036AA4B6B
MNSYRVTWEIDLEADDPEEAAHKALSIQRDPDSTATVFGVYGDDRYAEVDTAAVEYTEPGVPLARTRPPAIPSGHPSTRTAPSTREDRP